jgi:hypothetical protein
MSVAAAHAFIFRHWPLSWLAPCFCTANRIHLGPSLRPVRVLAIAAVVVLLGIGAVWVAKHAPVPSNHPSASQLARDRRLELAYRALKKRIGANARRARARQRARGRWARRANRICGEAVPFDRVAFRRLMRGGQSLPELLDMISRIETATRRVLSDLEALPPPPGRAAAFKRMLRAYERGFAVNEQMVAALRRGQLAGVPRMLRRATQLNLQGDDIARRLDANVCADGIFADAG